MSLETNLLWIIAHAHSHRQGLHSALAETGRFGWRLQSFDRPPEEVPGGESPKAICLWADQESGHLGWQQALIRLGERFPTAQRIVIHTGQEAEIGPIARALGAQHCLAAGEARAGELAAKVAAILRQGPTNYPSTWREIAVAEDVPSVITSQENEEWLPATKPPLNCRILLVEDGLDNQRLVSLILRKAGAQVDIAENGRRGFEMAVATFPDYGHRYNDPKLPYDLVIMDMQMPVMDGYEATRKLRSAGFRKPVIALTAHALPEDRGKCLSAGCDDYATKPIQRQHLIELLQLYLEKSRQIENTPGIPCDPSLCDEATTRR